MKETLSTARAIRGLTQEQMAQHLKIAISTYNQYENGIRNIPRQTARNISLLLNMKMEDLFLPTKFTVSKIERKHNRNPIRDGNPE